MDSTNVAYPVPRDHGHLVAMVEEGVQNLRGCRSHLVATVDSLLDMVVAVAERHSLWAKMPLPVKSVLD